jgi:ATP phosphoribosyltransferase
MRRSNVRIAIQKSGRLREQSEKLLKEWGIDCRIKDKNVLVLPCNDGKYEVLFVRYGDIPQYVQSGAVDFGIVGQNILFENKFNVKVVRELGFGRCKLIVAAPKRSSIKSPQDLEGERIATSYPNSLRKYLKQEGCGATIVRIRGGVEAAPAIGLADAICDITQTGTTLKANGLKIISTILESQAVLIESRFTTPKMERFKRECLEIT